MKKVWIVILLLLPLVTNGQENSILDRKISIVFDDVSLEEALFQLLDEKELNLFFLNKDIPEKVINVRFSSASLRRVFSYLFKNTPLKITIDNDALIVKKREVENPPKLSYFTISGYVKDQSSGELLPGANLYFPAYDQGTFSNEYGFYSVTLPQGFVKMEASFLGREQEAYSFELVQDTTLDIGLQNDLTLTEVIVTAADSSTRRLPVDVNADRIDIRQAKLLPRMGGENDLIRILHLLPGVQTGPDGVGGLSVRGGNAGHNLILSDGVPVYNGNHASGLLSIFNPSVVQSAKLIKSNFPARYGGRLSAVLDVRTRNGNNQEYVGEAELGLLSSKLTVEGPIQKDKSAFLLAGRLSILDWYLEPSMRAFKAGRGEDGSSSYDFYDVNAKLNFTLSENDRLFISFYKGADGFTNYGSQNITYRLPISNNEILSLQLDEAYEENFDWGNTLGAIRWNRILTPSLFMNTTATISSLRVGINYEQSDKLEVVEPITQTIFDRLEVGEYTSSIEEISLKSDFEWLPNWSNTIRFGMDFSGMQFQPGLLRYDQSFLEQIENSSISNRLISAISAAVYIENNQEFSRNFHMNYGIRASLFHVDERTYTQLEPRITAFYQLLPGLQLYSGVSKTSQYLHLLSNSTIGLPTDLWVPSTAGIAPEIAWQYSLGGNWRINKALNLNAEVYYKTMDQLLTYSEGVLFLSDWEENATSGSGMAYGLDLMLQAHIGKTTGWISYSAGRTDRQFDKVNQGNAFPFRYDRRHDLKLSVLHKFNNHWSASLSWLWGTGLAFSFPVQQYTIDIPDVPTGPITVIDYGSKNQFRLPAYHRLDLGLSYQLSREKLQHQFHVGVYNAYDQTNPLYYKVRSNFEIEGGQIQEEKEFVEVRLFPILPSLSYSVKF